MYKWVSLGVGAVFLSGCALPVPFQIASWALDGISMLATQKSVTDHGISLVAQQDCAIWRGVTKGELCREDEQSDVLVAEDAVETPTVASLQPSSIPRNTGNSDPVSRLENVSMQRRTLQVRAVPTHALRAAWAESERSNKTAGPASHNSVNSHALRAISYKPAPSLKTTTVLEAKTKAVPQAVQVAAVVPSRKPKSPPAVSVQSNVPTKGIYFVIGSFRNPDNARRLKSGNEKLSPAVLNAKLDGSDVYRVVVGPVPRGREKRLHRALARDGFPDTWAIRINPSDWQFAKLPMPRSKASPEVATLLK